MNSFLKYSLLILLVTVVTSCTIKKSSVPEIENGKITLSANALKKPVKLNGAWEFFWDRHLDTKDAHYSADLYIEVPGIWRGKIINGAPLPGTGNTSYRVTVHIPGQRYTNLAIHVGSVNTAYDIRINGELIGSCGVLGNSKEEMKPRLNNVVYSVPPVEDSFEIVLNISNFLVRTGGIWSEIEIGPVTEISRSQNIIFAFDIFILGILLIMGIYHTFMYIFRHKEKSSLMFGLYCLIFSLRVSLVNTRLLHILIGENLWVFLYKLEFLTFYAAVPVFMLLIYNLYRQTFNKNVLKLMLLFAAFFCVILLVVPVNIVPYTVRPYQIYTILSGVYVMYVLIYGAIHKHQGARLFLVGMVVLFITVVIDILRTILIINIRHVSPIGITFVVVLQSIIMAKRFTNSFNKIENLTTDLFTTNMAYSRFVPHELLDLLQLKSISFVKLGSSKEMDMTILFADIRKFTEMSETMTPQENFNFLNSFYSKVSPVIRRNGGFIDKYIGDGFMALFPGKSDDAVLAAVEMQNSIDGYNEERKRAGYRPIQVGIGIHSGSIILGTIGDEERMDGTVISDTVNLAARLEDLTKIGAPIIISHTTLYSLQDLLEYNYRFIGEMFVKGKQNRASVFEIYDGCTEEIIQLKNKTKRYFEIGITCLANKEYNKAVDLFNHVLSIMPEDKVARFYLDRIQYGISIPFRFHESMLEVEE